MEPLSFHAMVLNGMKVRQHYYGLSIGQESLKLTIMFNPDPPHNQFAACVRKSNVHHIFFAGMRHYRKCSLSLWTEPAWNGFDSRSIEKQ